MSGLLTTSSASLSRDDVLAIVKSLTEKEKADLVEMLRAKPWRPMSKPQVMAVESQADELFYGGAAGGGKALELPTSLPTPTGWTTMGEVGVGDWLLDEKGQPCRVTAISEVMHNRRCFAVLFSDQSVLVADAEHQWLTVSYGERMKSGRRTEEFRAARRAKRPSRSHGTRPHVIEINRGRKQEYLDKPVGTVCTTDEIRETLTARRGKAFNHCVAVASPLALPERELPIDPYILGAWLGDGTSRKSEMKKISRDPYRFHVGGLFRQLRINGLWGNKHIPAAYLRASLSQRLSLAQGLMDTDGCVTERGHCEFTTTKVALRDGMLELLSSLGIKATIRQGLAKLKGRTIGLQWRLKFLTALPIFRLPRKRDRQKRQGFRGTHSQRYIEDVIPVPSVPVKCVAVDSPSRLYLAGRTMIPTHNTSLLLGLALTLHRRSIVFRRQYPQIRELVEQSRELAESLGKFNGHDNTWRLHDGRTLEFGAVQHEKDKSKWQGQPHDLVAFDELPSFTQTQYRFLIGWNRSSVPGQRCRVVGAGNPPMRPEEQWVVEEWGPWLDPRHPEPAESGELRWYSVVDDKLVWRKTGEPFEHKGETIQPRSRTFIPARLDDNPILSQSGYRSVLQSLPEPMRSQLLYGDFQIGLEDHPYQVIPTAWIQASMKRWRENRLKTEGKAITMLGVDVARGGRDQTAIAKRYGRWVGPVVVVPGKDTPDGPSVANLVQRELLSQDGRPVINVDVIGVGSSAYDSLRALRLANVMAVDFSRGTELSDHGGQLRFANTRAWAYWALRDQLDPNRSDAIMLPDDQELLAELAAPRWRMPGTGIYITSKDDIKEVIGRSPDRADAVVLACYPVMPGTPASLGAGLPSVHAGTVQGAAMGMGGTPATSVVQRVGGRLMLPPGGSRRRT